MQAASLQAVTQDHQTHCTAQSISVLTYLKAKLQWQKQNEGKIVMPHLVAQKQASSHRRQDALYMKKQGLRAIPNLEASPGRSNCCDVVW